MGLVLGYAAVRALAGIEFPLPFPDRVGDHPLGAAVAVHRGNRAGGRGGVRADAGPGGHEGAHGGDARDEAGSSGGRKKANLRALLVAAQMALSTILIFGAGLFLRSLQSATTLDVGFSREPAAVVGIELDPNEYDAEADQSLIATLEQRLQAEPGITYVGTTGRMPLGLGTNVLFVDVPGLEPPPDANLWRVEVTRVTPGYFDAMGIELTEGRGRRARRTVPTRTRSRSSVEPRQIDSGRDRARSGP